MYCNKSFHVFIIHVLLTNILMFHNSCIENKYFNVFIIRVLQIFSYFHNSCFAKKCNSCFHNSCIADISLFSKFMYYKQILKFFIIHVLPTNVFRIHVLQTIIFIIHVAKYYCHVFVNVLQTNIFLFS